MITTAGLAMFAFAGASELKTGRTYYTETRLAEMKKAREKSPQAVTLTANAVKKAGEYKAMSWEELAAIIPPPETPRAFTVHINGCPVCGHAIYKHGGYPWIVSRKNPYKVTCPVCKKSFPDNDYQAYLASGLKDKSLLTGKYVDDGWGWKAPDDPKKYWFVAYYNHWMYYRTLCNELSLLRDAYLATGDPETGAKTAFILWKLARNWTLYDYNKQSRYALEFLSSYTGRVVNMIWETGTAALFPIVYDAVFPALQEDNAELMKATGCGMRQIRSDIEGLLRQMAIDIMDNSGRIRGNYGMHQKALLNIAIALKGCEAKPESDEMVSWICDFSPKTSASVMPLDYAFDNNLFTDGTPLESPGYNIGWVSNLTSLMSRLRELGRDYYATEPRVKQLYLWCNAFTVGGRNCQALGDTSGMSARRYNIAPQDSYTAFRIYGEPMMAAAVKSASPKLDFTYPSAPVDREALEEACATAGPLAYYTSTHLPGLGFATLQTGDPKHPAGMSMFYGRHIGHQHYDRLHIEFFSGGIALNPDFGYPDTASSMDPRRYSFFENTLSHNTVVVDSMMQASSARGDCLNFITGDFAQYIDTNCPGAYPGRTSKYRRSVLVLKIDGRQVALDVFRVQGGSSHDWFFHGNGPAWESTQLQFTPQKGGTLAGQDVELGFCYDDKRYQNIPRGSANYGAYNGSGYYWLHDVQTAADSGGAVTLKSFKGESLGTVLHLLPPSDGQGTLAVCQAEPQDNVIEPASVAFVVRRRSGQALSSTFASVIEAGPLPSAAASVKTLVNSSKDICVSLELRDGRRVIAYQRASAPKPLAVEDFTLGGTAGAIELSTDGKTLHAFVLDGTISKGGIPVIRSEAPFTAKAANVDAIAAAVMLDTPVPKWCDGKQLWAFSARKAYKVTADGKKLSLPPRGLVCGRFKIAKYDATTRILSPIPRSPLYLNGATLLRADGRSAISKVTHLYGNMKLVQDASDMKPLDADFLLSEIGPEDTITIHGHAEF